MNHSFLNKSRLGFQSNIYRKNVNNILSRGGGNVDKKEIPFNKEIGDSSITTGVNTKKLNYSPLSLLVRKNVNRVIGGAEMGLNFMKEWGVNPYLQEQLNTLNVFSGNIIERNRARAALTGGLLTPRIPLGMFIANYPRTWIDKTVYKLSPATANAVFDARNKLNNVFLSPLSKVFQKSQRILRDIEGNFYSNKEHKERLAKRRKFREKVEKNTSGRIIKLENAINKKTRLPKLSLFLDT